MYQTGIISIHNAKIGELLWEYDTGEQIIASPAVINGAMWTKFRLKYYGTN